MNVDKFTDDLFDWLDHNRPVVKSQLRDYLDGKLTKVEVPDLFGLTKVQTEGIEDQIKTLANMTCTRI